jgi:hypothetical protein
MVLLLIVRVALIVLVLLLIVRAVLMVLVLLLIVDLKNVLKMHSVLTKDATHSQMTQHITSLGCGAASIQP